MFLTKNLTRYGYGCLLALVLVGVFLAVHINISVFGADSGLTVTPHTVTVGTCTRSGVYTQKFVRNPSSHSTYTTHWSPGLPDLALGYQITLDGFGYVQATMSYSVGSGHTGSYTWPPLKVGDWGHRVIGVFGLNIYWAPKSTRVTAMTSNPELSFSQVDNHAYGTYTWSSSGTATLQAKYCKQTSSDWCEWEDVSSTVSEPFSGSGSWELKMTYVCHKCNQDVRYPSQHQTTCIKSMVYQQFDNRGMYLGMARTQACGKTYWHCVGEGHRAHGIRAKCPKDNCGLREYTCGPDHTCEGTTTSPTVQNNGGTSGTTTSPTVSSGSGSGSGGGSGSGDSGSRVKCQNTPVGAIRRNRRHCDKGGYASSAYAHRTTCWKGHGYWSCDAIARRYHTSSPSHRR